MTGPAPTAPTGVWRVEKGSPTPEELAALTAVLLSRTTPRPAQDPAPGTPGPRARWRRPERVARPPAPRSWLG